MPGYVWHITHRCHKQEFLLKFAQTRQRYIHWLYQARKRFGVEILNYAITSNHIHLVVRDGRGGNNIPAMIQLVAGRTGQEYNARKNRKGAFWEDRYHATAIETGKHLQRCLLYVDLNMVRAGVVNHPEDWAHGGYHEIQGNRRRNTIVDQNALADALELSSVEALRTAHGGWIEEALQGPHKREEAWSQSVAVGSAEFILRTQAALGLRGRNRDTAESDDAYMLRETEENYGLVFGVENGAIGPKNAHFWDVFC
nr:transposase [Desulfuromonas soudanensis]